MNVKLFFNCSFCAVVLSVPTLLQQYIMGTDRSQAFRLITAIKPQLFPQTVSEGDSDLQSGVFSL